MQTKPLNNSDELETEPQSDKHIPFDGFIDVNDLVRKRRKLRNAAFNVPDTESNDAFRISADEQDEANKSG